MDDVKCPNCGTKNKNTNIKCEYCGNLLEYKKYKRTCLNSNEPLIKKPIIIKFDSKKSKILVNIILIFLVAPFLMISLRIVGISTYNIISKNNEFSSYLETKGVISPDTDCDFDNKNDSCIAVYEYNVNGKTYKGKSYSLISKLRKTTTVKYNLDNPKEYYID